MEACPCFEKNEQKWEQPTAVATGTVGSCFHSFSRLNNNNTLYLERVARNSFSN